MASSRENCFFQDPRGAASTRTRIVRTFDLDEVRRLKADAERDLTVDGPGLAAMPAPAGLVDEASHVLLYA